MSLTPNACCMAAAVPVSLMVRRSGLGVSLSTVSPNSFAKVRTTLIAAGSAPCFWRYSARVRRSLPRRLVFRRLLRFTMTETVMTLEGRTGFSPVAAERGAFSLPANTTRGCEEKRRADFFAGMGSSPVQYDAHNIPVCCPREDSPAIHAHIHRLAAQEPAAPPPPFLSPARSHRRYFLQLPDRGIVFCRPAVVSVAELWGCLHKNAGPGVERIRLFCHRDVSPSLRFVRGAKTDPSAGFAQ